MTIEEGIKQAVTDFGEKILAEERLVNILNDYQAFEGDDAYKLIARHIIQNKCVKQFTSKGFFRFSRKINAKEKQQIKGVVRNIASVTGTSKEDVCKVVDAFLFALGYYYEGRYGNSSSAQYVTETVIDSKPFLSLVLLLVSYASQFIYLNYLYNQWWMSVCVFFAFIVNFIVFGILVASLEERNPVTRKVEKNKLERFYKMEIVKSYLPLFVAITLLSTWLYPLIFHSSKIVAIYNVLFGTYAECYEGSFFVSILCLFGLYFSGALTYIFSFFKKENRIHVRGFYTKRVKIFNAYKHVIICFSWAIFSILIPTTAFLSYVIVNDSIEECDITKRIEALDEINTENLKKTVDLSYKELKLGASYQECVKQIEYSGSMEWDGDFWYDNGHFKTAILGGTADVFCKTLDGKIFEIILELNTNRLASICDAFESKYGSTGFNEERQTLEYQLKSSKWYILRNGAGSESDLQSYRDSIYRYGYYNNSYSWKIEFANGSITISNSYYSPDTILYRDKVLYERYIAICEQKKQQRLIDEDNARKAQRQKEINDSIRVVKAKEREKMLEQIKNQKEVEKFAADI